MINPTNEKTKYILLSIHIYIQGPCHLSVYSLYIYLNIGFMGSTAAVIVVVFFYMIS